MSERRSHRAVRYVASCAAVLLVVAVHASAAAAGSRPVVAACPGGDGPLRTPVEAPVSDPFRLPDGPFRAGNRGLEYATRPGSTVRAAASGEVTFAGAIAGERYVTVRHDDGLLASYSYLAGVAAGVAPGRRIAAGTVLGTTTGRFQFGLRRDGAHLDPGPLLGRRTRARLAPDATAPPAC